MNPPPSEGDFPEQVPEPRGAGAPDDPRDGRSGSVADEGPHEGPDAESAAEPDAAGDWVEGADRFVADARGDEAVEARRRERWTRQRRLEATTLTAALDAAVGIPVTLLLRTGSRLHATINDLGVDHVEVRAQAATHWIPLRVVAGLESDRVFVIEPEDAAEATSTLDDVLEHLAADDCRIAVTLSGGTVVRGRPVAAGAAFTLQTMDTDRSVIMALDAIDLITLLDPA